MTDQANAERCALFSSGEHLILEWCRLNAVDPPEIAPRWDDKAPFKGYGACAYYRRGVIHIWPRACAPIGAAGRQWSYPGYAVDRTPYGVLAHELGHHVDEAEGRRPGSVSGSWRRLTAAPPLTSYCPNDNEWFAEHFRLFVTNPDLSRRLATDLYKLMLERWPRLSVESPWDCVLAGAPRQLQAARNRISKAAKRR